MRNLKALGLALVAMLAMGAMAATAASAQEVTAEGYPTALHGQSANHVFEAESGDVKCGNSTFEAELTKASSEVSITPTYDGGCTAAGNPATVFTNGCEYVLHDVEGSEGHYETEVDIACGASPIEVRVYAGGSHGFRVCTISVPSQNNLGSVTVENNAETSAVTMSGTVTGVDYTESGLCGAGEGEATYQIGSTPVTGTNPFHVG